MQGEENTVGIEKRPLTSLIKLAQALSTWLSLGQATGTGTPIRQESARLPPVGLKGCVSEESVRANKERGDHPQKREGREEMASWVWPLVWGLEGWTGVCHPEGPSGEEQSRQRLHPSQLLTFPITLGTYTGQTLRVMPKTFRGHTVGTWSSWILTRCTLQYGLFYTPKLGQTLLPPGGLQINLANFCPVSSAPSARSQARCVISGKSSPFFFIC